MSWEDILKKSGEDEYAEREARERREEKAASYDKPERDRTYCPRCKGKNMKDPFMQYCDKCEREVEMKLQDQIRDDPYGGDDLAWHTYEGDSW